MVYTANDLTLKGVHYDLVYVKIVIPSYNDLASTSQLDSLKASVYKLEAKQITYIKNKLTRWLKNARISKSADRAIPLPYNVSMYNDINAREEEIMRKGNVIGEHQYTISEASFWNYFACEQILKTYYKDNINAETYPTNEYWIGASKLLYDLYVLVKASIDDSVLDDNNNITNFSMEQEGAVVINKLNVVQY